MGTSSVFCDGAPGKMSTCLVASHAAITTLNSSCNNQHSHIKLEESLHRKIELQWLGQTGRICSKIAKTRSFLQEVCCGLRQSTVRDGLLESYPGSLWLTLLRASTLLRPLKSTTTIARYVSAGLQPSKLAIPQLVQDGLGPAEHLVVAQNVVHQYL